MYMQLERYPSRNAFFFPIGKQNHFVKRKAKKNRSKVRWMYKKKHLKATPKTKRDTNNNPLNPTPTTPQSLQKQ